MRRTFALALAAALGAGWLVVDAGPVLAQAGAAEGSVPAVMVGCRRCGGPCNPYAPCCPRCGVRHPAAAAAPGEAAPSEVQPSPAAEAAAPEPSMLAGNFGAAQGPASSAPYMIGDFFGTVGVPIFVGPNFATSTGAIAASPSSMVNRFKMAETTSPIPRDRVFFNYTFYRNVALSSDGIDVSSYMPGFEKTFFDGLTSFELRFPIASTRSSDLFPDALDTVGKKEGEFGNISMAFKGLFLRRESFVLSAGLGLIVPTADDVRFFLDPTLPAFGVIENQSLHYLPFIGAVWTPTNEWFVQSYLQIDIDGNGNPVKALHPRGSGQDPGLVSIGRYTEPTVLYFDVAVGYWLRRNDYSRCISGIAPIVELHLNQGLQDTDEVRDPLQVFNVGVAETMSILDLTAGVRFELGRRTDLTMAYATPLTNDRQFDGEFRLLLNLNF